MSIQSLTRINNLFPMPAITGNGKNLGAKVNAGGSYNKNRNLANTRIPIQIPRIKQDINSWRGWITEAEQAWWPFRVKMQQGFLDTVLNAHIFACMERRKNLTLLREYEFCNEDGSHNEEWTKYFQKRWFKHNFVNYTLDSLFYGYNLISLGDIGSEKKNAGIMDCHPLNPTIITRFHVSPDREEVGSFIYSPVGKSFEKGIPDDFHVFVTTMNDTGIGNCGYGLLYPAAYLEILLRNNTGYNTDFIELFAQPLRVLYTNAMEGPEQDKREQALQNMASSAYIMLNDMGERMEFMTDNARGNGYKAYNDFDQRVKGDISKLFLGHQDAISSVPGKQGSSQVAGGPTHEDEAATPIAQALRDIQSKDGQFCEPVFNDLLLPKLRNLGIPVPENGYIHYLNDAEERAIQAEKNKVNQAAGTLFMTLAQAGKKVDNDYIEEVMGFPTGSIEDMPIMAGSPDSLKQSGVPNEKKEPKDAIKTNKPFKEREKNRPGKQ